MTLPIRSVTSRHVAGSVMTAVEHLFVQIRLLLTEHNGCPLATACGTSRVHQPIQSHHLPNRGGQHVFAEGSLSVPAVQQFALDVYATAHSTTRTSHNSLYRNKPLSTPSHLPVRAARLVAADGTGRMPTVEHLVPHTAGNVAGAELDQAAIQDAQQGVAQTHRDDVTAALQDGRRKMREGRGAQTGQYPCEAGRPFKLALSS